MSDNYTLGVWIWFPRTEAFPEHIWVRRGALLIFPGNTLMRYSVMSGGVSQYSIVRIFNIQKKRVGGACNNHQDTFFLTNTMFWLQKSNSANKAYCRQGYLSAIFIYILSCFYCQTPTPTQHSTTVGFDMKMTGERTEIPLPAHLFIILSNSSLRPRARSWLYFLPMQQNHVNLITKPRQPCNITTSTL